ncbi:50s ribosomal protein l7/l12 [Quercus suber]|uniref:50s ribosomal protein l7/l12 n=1 Tax=Quercus suber TaxID=58331 RepID=A0AAW0LC54_QUESU
MASQDGPPQVRPSTLRARPILGFRIRSRVGRGGQGRGEERVRFEAGEVRRAAKIKIIKEVRTFTDLGLKEAKELVEKVPVVLKKGLTKEEADPFLAKLKNWVLLWY